MELHCKARGFCFLNTSSLFVATVPGLLRKASKFRNAILGKKELVK
jgi:hypothetical protein